MSVAEECALADVPGAQGRPVLTPSPALVERRLSGRLCAHCGRPAQQVRATWRALCQACIQAGWAWCSSCRSVKPRREFQANRARWNGVMESCRACESPHGVALRRRRDEVMTMYAAGWPPRAIAAQMHMNRVQVNKLIHRWKERYL